MGRRMRYAALFWTNILLLAGVVASLLYLDYQLVRYFDSASDFKYELKIVQMNDEGRPRVSEGEKFSGDQLWFHEVRVKKHNLGRASGFFTVILRDASTSESRKAILREEADVHSGEEEVNIVKGIERTAINGLEGKLQLRKHEAGEDRKQRHVSTEQERWVMDGGEADDLDYAEQYLRGTHRPHDADDFTSLRRSIAYMEAERAADSEYGMTSEADDATMRLLETIFQEHKANGDVDADKSSAVETEGYQFLDDRVNR